MKQTMLFMLGIIVSLVVLDACKKKKEKEEETPNLVPTATLIFPPNNWAGIADDDSTIVLEAQAADSDGAISKVEFYINEAKVGEKSSSPFTFPYLFRTGVSYNIKVTAVDNKGASATSATHSATLFHN